MSTSAALMYPEHDDGVWIVNRVNFDGSPNVMLPILENYEDGMDALRLVDGREIRGMSEDEEDVERYVDSNRWPKEVDMDTYDIRDGKGDFGAEYIYVYDDYAEEWRDALANSITNYLDIQPDRDELEESVEYKTLKGIIKEVVEESKTIEEGMDVFDEYKVGDHVTVQHGGFGGNTVGGNQDESVITKVFYDDEEVAFHTTGDYQSDAEIGGTDNVALLQKTIAELTPFEE